MAAGNKRKRLIRYGKYKPRRRNNIPHEDDSMSWFPASQDIDQSQKPPPLPPKKPGSQKEAMMAAEPPADKVQNMMEFTGMDRSTAVKYLKAKQNNIEQAAEAFFNGEDISKAVEANTWDESAWDADRDGGNHDQNNHLLRPLGAASAPGTRPNSPAPSQRSNLQPNSKQEEDDDLYKAMAMSQNDISGGFQQESGRIGPNGQQFGPATRSEYDRDKWALVPAGSGFHHTNEIVPDADVKDRANVPGEPRLLKQLPGGDYVANLLSICCAIPGAREALLMPGFVQTNYGQDGEWWKGHAIAMPRIVHVDDGSPAEPDADKHDDLLAEVQRLMAFLGASSRSYASVAPLAQVDVIKEANLGATRSRTLLEVFLNQWITAASTKSAIVSDMSTLFNTTVGTNAPDGMDTPNMSLIDMPVNINGDSEVDLFELLDGLLWDTNDDNTTISDNYIERPAEVLVMNVHRTSPATAQQLRVSAPAAFYIDKYLPEHVESTRATRLEMIQGKKRISKIEEIENKLTKWQHPATKNETLEASMLLKYTHGHFSGQNRAEAAKSDRSNSVVDAPVEQLPHHLEIAQKLEKVIASIDNKLVVLKNEKEKTRKAIADMSKAPPPGLQTEDLKHRYTLRGVATKPNITYVLCPTDPNTANGTIESDEATPEGMTWWRMEYEVDISGSSAKVTKARFPGEDVLRAVELEHSSALLVYASDRVTDPSLSSASLPAPLQDFINRDNELFMAELQEDRTKPPTYSFDIMSHDEDVPRQSIERSSMDSTRVEGEPSPPPYGDDDGYFEQHSAFGLPPIKQGFSQGEDLEEDGPVHEIQLDDLGVEDEGLGAEMVERVHEPLIPGLGAGSGSGTVTGGGGDSVMEDAGQHSGVGGNVRS